MGVANSLRAGRPGKHSSIPSRDKGFFKLSKVSRSPLNSTRPQTDQMLVAHFPGVKTARDVKWMTPSGSKVKKA